MEVPYINILKKIVTLRKSFFFAALLFSSLPFSLLSQDFTWMRGSSSSGSIAGVYGTPGVSAPGNDPGSRHGAATWVDNAGNLWMFGGEGHSSVTTYSWLNDLWKYDPLTNQWTFIRGSMMPNATGNYGTQGVPAPSNEPGAREFAVTWTDKQGKFWMFGGDGFASSPTQTMVARLGDLWKYDPVTNQWTWMHGFNTTNQNGVYGTMNVPASSNLPGARYAAGKWVDANGDLWMFGGKGFPASGTNIYLNDMWKYTISTNQWTWIGGTNLGQQNGNYGSINVAAPSNIPGGVEFPCSWVSSSGVFYMFGGRGLCGSGLQGYLGDLWKYDPSSNLWTWIKGANLTNQNSNYGTLNVSGASVMPGSRYSAAAWKDFSGKFYLFGGYGFSAASLGNLNDVFRYDPVTNEFTWIKGSNGILSGGTYGTMGVPNSANIPGARYFNTYWTASAGSVFWLFGAYGNDISASPTNNMQDLWKYSLACNPDSLLASPSPSICSGHTITLSAFSQNPSSVAWYSTQVGGSPIGTGSMLITPPVNPGLTSTVITYYAEANSCTVMPRTAIQITVSPTPTVLIAGPSTLCAGHSATLTASGALSFSWTNGPATNTYVVIPPISTTYSVEGVNGPGCTNSNTFQISTLPSPSLSLHTSTTIICQGNSATLTVNGAVSYSWSVGQSTSNSIVVTPSINTIYTVIGTGTNNCTAKATVTVSLCNLAGLNNAILPQSGLRIFPNPTSGKFSILFDWLNEPAELKIYTLLGQQIYQAQLSELNTSIYLENHHGVYIYTLSSSKEKLLTGKIILE